MKKIVQITSILLLMQSFFVLVAVLERLFAALFKLFMFHFAWPQPIFLSKKMVVLFLGYTVIVIAFSACLLWATSASSPGTGITIRWAIYMNVMAAIVVFFAISTKLAVMSGII